MVQLAEQLNEDEPVDGLLWAVLYNRIPQTLRDAVLDPYVRIEDNELRFNVRVRESAPDLEPQPTACKGLKPAWRGEFGFAPDQVRLTGLLVMYNNVLQSHVPVPDSHLGGGHVRDHADVSGTVPARR